MCCVDKAVYYPVLILGGHQLDVENITPHADMAATWPALMNKEMHLGENTFQRCSGQGTLLAMQCT